MRAAPQDSRHCPQINRFAENSNESLLLSRRAKTRGRALFCLALPESQHYEYAIPWVIRNGWGVDRGTVARNASACCVCVFPGGARNEFCAARYSPIRL